MVPEPGWAYQIHYGDGHPSNETLHVRAIVDGQIVVVARWSPWKGWRYFCEYLYTWKLRESGGNIKGRRRSTVFMQDGEGEP